MKLAAKLIAAFLTVIVASVITETKLAIHRGTKEFEATAVELTSTIAIVLEPAVLERWKNGGLSAVDSQLQTVNGQQQGRRVRLVFLEADVDRARRPEVPLSRLTPIAHVDALVQPHPVLAEEEDIDQNGYLEVYWPIQLGPRKGALEFAHSLSSLSHLRNELIYEAVIRHGVFFLLVALMFLLLGIRLIGRPINRLMAKTHRIAAGDLNEPLELHTGDELTELAHALNHLCANLSHARSTAASEAAARAQALEQLRHADRLQTVGRLAAGVAHELGTPLAVVSGRAGMIASHKLTPDEIHESSLAIRAESERMTAAIKQLLRFARREPPRRAPADLCRIAAESIETIGALAREQHCVIESPPCSQPCPASVDSSQIRQVLANLLMNAMQSMPGGGTVQVSIDPNHVPPADSGRPPGPFVRIQVRDHGQGIAPEHLPHVFEPFFTTKDSDKGTGLGLSIAWGIVEDHGGWMSAESTPGAGSCFSVFLPQQPPHEIPHSGCR